MAGLRGWGGRIRTSIWRNQNPLPYCLELAAPDPRSRVQSRRRALVLPGTPRTGSAGSGLDFMLARSIAVCIAAAR